MDKNKKTYTSQNFVRRPLEVFRSAHNGCRTIINHAQYPEGVFELTYRKREPCFSEQPEPGDQMVAPMTNEIHLSKAELEIATTCSDKPAQDHSKTSCSNNAVKQCYTCKSWKGDKAKVLRQIEINPDCMDKFKGWPESGGCGIHYQWLEITIRGDAIADIEVPANFCCNYWN